MSIENPLAQHSGTESQKPTQFEGYEKGKMDKSLKIGEMAFESYVALLEQALMVPDYEKRAALLDMLGTHDNEHVYADADFDAAVTAFAEQPALNGRYRPRIVSRPQESGALRSKMFTTKVLAVCISETDPEDELARLDFRASRGAMRQLEEGEEELNDEDYRNAFYVERAQFLIDVLKYCLDAKADPTYCAYGPYDEREDRVWVSGKVPKGME